MHTIDDVLVVFETVVLVGISVFGRVIVPKGSIIGDARLDTPVIENLSAGHCSSCDKVSTIPFELNKMLTS
jgi:hypothetical protein